MTDMTIGKVADVVGVGVETICFYDRRKLIEQRPRPREGGYLIYSRVRAIPQNIINTTE